MRRPARARRGASAVEFALCLWFGLIPILMGIMDWAWFFFIQMSFNTAANDAARLAAQVDMSSTCPDVVMSDELSTGLSWMSNWVEVDDTNISVHTEDYGVPFTNVNEMSVAVVATYQPLIGVPFVPTPSNFGTQVVVFLEDQRDLATYGCDI